MQSFMTGCVRGFSAILSTFMRNINSTLSAFSREPKRVFKFRFYGVNKVVPDFIVVLDDVDASSGQE